MEFYGPSRTEARLPQHVLWHQWNLGVLQLPQVGDHFRAYVYVYTWKIILPFGSCQNDVSSFFVEYGVFVKYTVFLQPTGTFFVSTTC